MFFIQSFLSWVLTMVAARCSHPTLMAAPLALASKLRSKVCAFAEGKNHLCRVRQHLMMPYTQSLLAWLVFITGERQSKDLPLC